MDTEHHFDAKLPALSAVSTCWAHQPVEIHEVVEHALEKAFPSNVARQTGSLTMVFWSTDIVQADGTLVAPNAEHWLKQQTQLVGATTLLHGIKQEGFRLARNGGNLFMLSALMTPRHWTSSKSNFVARAVQYIPCKA